MPTNQELIDSALSEANYHEAGESANATDSADALTALNNFMHEWRVMDKDLNWFTQDTLTDTAPLPNWAVKGVTSAFALRLCGVFNLPVTQKIFDDGKEGENAIATTLINLKLTNTDMTHLPVGDGRAGLYNIDTDAI